MESNQNSGPLINIYDSLWSYREKILKSPVSIAPPVPGYVNHIFIYSFKKEEWNLYSGADKLYIFSGLFSKKHENSVEMMERGDWIIFRLMLGLPENSNPFEA